MMAGKGPGITCSPPAPPPPQPPPPPPPPSLHGAPQAPESPPPPDVVSPLSSSKLPHGMTPKKKFKFEVQTKRVNWNKVQANKMDKGAFWITVNENRFEEERLCQSLLETFAVGTKGTGHEEVKVKKKVKELKVLDPKSAQNLSILLGSIKVPFTEIKRRIEEVDEDNLNTVVLEQLIRYLPEPKKMKKMASLKNQYGELAEPEQFAVEISSIEGIHPRLKSMLFKMSFPEIVEGIKSDLVAAKEALEEIKNSGKFAKILEMILLIGNILNAGSRNAESFGFDISFLPKLQNTKASDGKTTLVHFLAKFVEEKYPDMFKFTDELSYVERACRVSNELLQKNLRAMENSLRQLENDIKNLRKTQTEHDKFCSVMNEFITPAKDEYEVMKDMYKMVDNLYKEMGKYYTFNVKRYAMEEFFKDIKAFMESFVQAWKDNAKIREANQKIRNHPLLGIERTSHL